MYKRQEYTYTDHFDVYRDVSAEFQRIPADASEKMPDEQMDKMCIRDRIPGYSPRDCGNYLDNNLTLAKIYMKKYKEEVLDNPVPERLHYPQ